MRVLLVEDDAALRDTLQRSLETEGYESEVAASANEAITRAREQDFDLIVTDYNLGHGKNGLFLLSQLKKSGCRIPTILMTGYRGERLEDAARKLGVSAFLEKPFSMDALLNECWRALQERPTTKNRKGRMRKCENDSSWRCP
jgi:DNA-binding NtrC family response regulator